MTQVSASRNVFPPPDRGRVREEVQQSWDVRGKHPPPGELRSPTSPFQGEVIAPHPLRRHARSG
jgi:hypothetical protein